MQGRLAPFILSTADPLQQNEVQPKSVKVLKIADYFAEYREKGDGLAAFLGASIIAKVIDYIPCFQIFTMLIWFSYRSRL